MDRIIPLWGADVPGFEESFGQPAPALTLFPAKHPRGAVLVLPGGGYQHKAAHEGAPIAERLNKGGIFAAVLDYRAAPYRAPVPQWDALRAVQWLRHLAPEFGYQPDHIAILGFSAGGHLAASTAYMQIPLPETAADDPLKDCSARPDAAVLCYPVITFGPYTHEGSRDNLLGEGASEDEIRYWSVENRITKDACPAFIWHTSDDGAVPVQNSLLLAQALSARQVPYALHIWPHGHHGLGLAEETEDIRQWPDLAVQWLHGLGY